MSEHEIDTTGMLLLQDYQAEAGSLYLQGSDGYQGTQNVVTVGMRGRQMGPELEQGTPLLHQEGRMAMPAEMAVALALDLLEAAHAALHMGLGHENCDHPHE